MLRDTIQDSQLLTQEMSKEEQHHHHLVPSLLRLKTHRESTAVPWVWVFELFGTPGPLFLRVFLREAFSLLEILVGSDPQHPSTLSPRASFSSGALLSSTLRQSLLSFSF